MSKANLPTGESTPAKAEWSQVFNNDKALLEAVNSVNNEQIAASAGIEASKLASTAKPFTWYTPKVIATEESRTNVAFGTLTTPDEITGVVVPENGIIQVRYRCFFKSSVEEAGRAAIFIGANQLKNRTGVASAETEAKTTTANFFAVILTSGSPTAPLEFAGTASVDVTTGQIQAVPVEITGLPAGTYTVSVQFKASSGSVTAKNRALRVSVVGF